MATSKKVVAKTSASYGLAKKAPAKKAPARKAAAKKAPAKKATVGTWCFEGAGDLIPTTKAKTKTTKPKEG